MPFRRVNVLIVLFWLAMTSWLVISKILPVIKRGDPPVFSAVAPTGEEDPTPQPVCWTVAWDGRPIGWAAQRSAAYHSAAQEEELEEEEEEEEEGTKIHSRVEFERLRLNEMKFSALKSMFSPLVEANEPFSMRILNFRRVDEDGRLQLFKSSVHLLDNDDPQFVVFGKVTEEQLNLVFQQGETKFPVKLFLPRDSVVGNEMSPQGYVTGLWEGRTWTSPVYSPLRLPGSPAEVLVALVERQETIHWNGRSNQCWRVTFRRDSGAGSRAAEASQGTMWVLHAPDSPRDGMVLRQRVDVLGSKLQFERLSREQAQPLADVLQADWKAKAPSDVTEALLQPNHPQTTTP